MTKTTPVKSIRSYCIECSAGQLGEVKNCSHFGCPLYPFRMGKRPKAELTPLRAIRRHCMECMREQRKEVDLCPSVKCPLHAYRSGHRPKQ